MSEQDESEVDQQEWLNTDMNAYDATGPAAAALISSVAETLADAPDEKRYDLQLIVEESNRS